MGWLVGVDELPESSWSRLYRYMGSRSSNKKINYFERNYFIYFFLERLILLFSKLIL